MKYVNTSLMIDSILEIESNIVGPKETRDIKGVAGPMNLSTSNNPRPNGILQNLGGFSYAQPRLETPTTLAL
jgi:hypothetical protein